MDYVTPPSFPSAEPNRTGFPTDGLASAKFPPCLLGQTPTASDVVSQQTLSLQAKNLGFRVAAQRIEELQAVVGKAVEEAASGNDSPVGIPPPRAKPAGVKPDPKARPFTPGTHFLTHWSQ